MKPDPVAWIALYNIFPLAFASPHPLVYKKKKKREEKESSPVRVKQ